MKISAVVNNGPGGHEVRVHTDTVSKTLGIPAGKGGRGSSVNGGEFLMLAVATCFCNDLYREAARMGIGIDGVEVEAVAEFPGPGLAATGICYRAKVSSSAAPERIAELLHRTDAVAEVHNTVRAGVAVELLG
ncbi:OsmC family protein [Massilia sp. METH4]|uniref:OsmC family protein n=1 Tax=Massilia sp. METH4 TaxID=3123041 RepID=UPI0030D48084